MNINANILKYVLIAWGLTVISCDKQETETNFQEEGFMEEGFMSTTENSNSEIEKSQEILAPLLHMTYDASLSQVEVEAKFQTEVSKFEKEVGPTNKNTKTLNYFMSTKTGSGAHNQTDGFVDASVTFKTDKGYLFNHPILDNSGNDREKGQWDLYYFRRNIAESIKWVELASSSIFLKGTDGWYITRFNVTATANGNRNTWATGRTTIIKQPNVWLDNTTSSGSDYYYAWEGAKGRLTHKK